MKKDFLERLKDGILICDGAMGTMLQSKGLPPGECGEKWGIDHPDILESIHRAYIDAGAEMIITNTFLASRFKLRRHGLDGKVREIVRRATEIAKGVAGDSAYVAGGLGPTGEIVKPYGDVAEEELREAFEEQVAGLVEGGADLIIIETLSALEEMRAAIAAAKTSGLPVVASMAFEVGKAGVRTMMGVTPTQALHTMRSAGADVVGANCGGGIEAVVGAIEEMRRSTDGYLIAEPNAGVPELVDGRTVFKETPEGMAKKLRRLVDLGVNVLGGCCGTTPDHIRAISDMMR
ncbi:MAG: homocysteine S-methyltransferase family protein [bacterium]